MQGRESVFMNLHKKLPKGDPRRDLFANTFEAYQQLAVAMKAYEQGRGQRPDATIGAAGVRKGMLTKILQGNMTPEEKICTMHGERRRKPILDSVKYWELIAENLSRAGWSWGCVATVDPGERSGLQMRTA